MWLSVGLIRSPVVLCIAVGLWDLCAYCRGAVVLGLTAGVFLSLVVLRGVVDADLMPSSAVLVCTVGTWVPVGLLPGLVVSHPVRESVRVVGVDQVIKGH